MNASNISVELDHSILSSCESKIGDLPAMRPIQRDILRFYLLISALTNTFSNLTVIVALVKTQQLANITLQV